MLGHPPIANTPVEYPGHAVSVGPAAICEIHIDPSEQQGILGIKCPMTVKILGAERRNPLGVQAFDCGRDAHGIPLTGIIIRT